MRAWIDRTNDGLSGMPADGISLPLKRGCPFRKLYPDVMVVQSGQDRDGDNSTAPLHRSTQGRVFAQGQVRPDLIVVRRIGGENLPQVRLAKNQHSVHALATHG